MTWRIKRQENKKTMLKFLINVTVKEWDTLNSANKSVEKCSRNDIVVAKESKLYWALRNDF